MEDTEKETKRKRKKRTKEELEKAYGTITLAGMTRPARLRSTRGWKLNPGRTPSVRRRAKNPRNEEAEEEEEDVREDNVRRRCPHWRAWLLAL